jgi:hypothetical protein
MERQLFAPLAGYTHSLSFQPFHRPNPATHILSCIRKFCIINIIHPTFSIRKSHIHSSFKPLSLSFRHHLQHGPYCINTPRHSLETLWFIHSARLPPFAFIIIVIFCIHIIRNQRHAYNRFYSIVFGLLVRSWRLLVGGLGRVLLFVAALVACSVWSVQREWMWISAAACSVRRWNGISPPRSFGV